MRTIRRNFTMPADWALALTREACERGVSEAEFVRLCIADKLPRDVREGLSTPKRPGREAAK